MVKILNIKFINLGDVLKKYKKIYDMKFEAITLIELIEHLHIKD